MVSYELAFSLAHAHIKFFFFNILTCYYFIFIAIKFDPKEMLAQFASEKDMGS